MLQVREKDLPEPEVRRLIERLRRLLPPGAILIANATGRPADFAARVAADGAHLGGGDLEAVAEARRALSPEAVIGYSAHREEEAAEAARRGADYLSLSPVFEPLSKPGAAPLGLERLERACRGSPIPIYALGGVTPARARAVREAGAWGAAVVGAILLSRDPQGAARELIAVLQ
jgi:thiamine-phosphate pyrophosphorylase